MSSFEFINYSGYNPMVLRIIWESENAQTSNRFVMALLEFGL
jgi:hypothetical protein